MTELEQRLLSELENLEKTRQAEKEALESYLNLFHIELKKITKLLEVPPKSEDIAKKLQPILTSFFDTLQKNLIASNEELIKEIQDSIDNNGADSYEH